MYKHILGLGLALLLPLSSFADDTHLQLTTKTHEVLVAKPNTLNLKQVQAKVVNDQLDLQISYERLYQAQKKISEARAQYFPYGLGTVATMYFLNIWNPLLLVELVTSLPSKVYNVQSEKNMSLAQQYSNEALKENIKNQVAHMYYNILKEDGVIKLVKLELNLLEKLLQAHKERVEAGLSTLDEVKKIELRILNLRGIFLKYSSYLSAEKAAFNQMMALAPSEANYELQHVSNTVSGVDLSMDLDRLVSLAKARSPEIVAADYTVIAASKAKKSVSWSILSFNGIGFGYWGRIQIAGSKIEDARLRRQLVEETLVNQVYVTHNSFKRSQDQVESEEVTMEDAEFFYNSELARFNDSDIDLDRLVESGIIYVKDFQRFVAAHYDSLGRLNDLERSVLGEVRKFDASAQSINANFEHWKGKKYTLSLEATFDLKDVAKVEYVFDDRSLNNVTTSNPVEGFVVVLKLYNPDGLKGKAHVTLKSGEVITTNFRY